MRIKLPDPKPSEVAFSHGRLRAFETTQIRCVYIYMYGICKKCISCIFRNMYTSYMYITYMIHTYVIYIYIHTSIHIHMVQNTRIHLPSPGFPAWQRTSRWRTCRQPSHEICLVGLRVKPLTKRGTSQKTIENHRKPI